ncbi:MAG: hypothetical protein ACN4GG_01665 [Akkermansiaceae bacterium]
MSSPSPGVALAVAIARVTLLERGRRRKLMSGILIVILAIFALGTWPLAKWLSGSIWLMLIWWGACTALCLFLVMLAVYDALAVVREERAKLVIEAEEDLEE